MIMTLRDSKARLSELVERAAGGEDVVITVRGKPKARLCPVIAEGRDGGAAWGKVLREARAAYSTGRHDSSGKILDELRGERS